jgi:hypothetical protein
MIATEEKQFMSYMVDSESGNIICQTPSEALALSRKIKAGRVGAAPPAAHRRSGPSKAPAPSNEPKPLTLVEVLEGLQKRPRHYMELLQKNPSGLADSHAWQDLELQKRGHISGVLTSLRNAFAKAGYSFEQVIDRKKHSNGNGREHISIIRPEALNDVKKGVPIVN